MNSLNLAISTWPSTKPSTSEDCQEPSDNTDTLKDEEIVLLRVWSKSQRQCVKSPVHDIYT